MWDAEANSWKSKELLERSDWNSFLLCRLMGLQHAGVKCFELFPLLEIVKIGYCLPTCHRCGLEKANLERARCLSPKFPRIPVKAIYHGVVKAPPFHHCLCCCYRLIPPYSAGYNHHNSLQHYVIRSSVVMRIKHRSHSICDLSLLMEWARVALAERQNAEIHNVLPALSQAVGINGKFYFPAICVDPSAATYESSILSPSSRS